jgi:hypothetical protein
MFQVSTIMTRIWSCCRCCRLGAYNFVNKDNKDLSLQPTTHPPGDTCNSALKKRHVVMQEEWAIAKAACPGEYGPVERYGDLDHQMKRTHVDGMRFQVE